MRHSLRLRLLLILVAVPGLALLSVAVVARIASDSSLDNRLKFQIVPVQRAGGGPQNPNDDQSIPVFSTEIDLDPSSQPVTFDTGDGQAYTITAERGFVQAYRQSRKNALNAINQQVTIAAVVVGIIALGAAFWLSRRIVRPVEELTTAAKLLESGDLSQRVRVTSGDEVGALGHAFNAMAESIERNQDLRKQMTSDVAHELRTPLNNISGYLEAISDGVVEPSADVIQSLEEEADLLIRLVADLEQLSLADAGHARLMLERVSLDEIASAAVARVQPRAANRDVTLRTKLGSIPEMSGDPSRLGQVVRNLLENAITHTPAGGTVTLTTKRSGDVAWLSVSDTGPGIEAAHLPYIFERFYRADPSRTRATGGAGLGLAIVKQLVEAHGGTVQAENLPGGGACFSVRLPLGAPPPKAPDVPVKAAVRPA
jgi:signal transduction histidine kinase